MPWKRSSQLSYSPTLVSYFNRCAEKLKDQPMQDTILYFYIFLVTFIVLYTYMPETYNYEIQTTTQRLKLAGAILGGLALPVMTLYPIMGEDVRTACSTGYTAPLSPEDSVFDKWGRNLAVNFCDAKVPPQQLPEQVVPQNPDMFNA